MKRLAFALCFAATPALAELTPEDLIQSWESYYAQMNGAIIIGSRETDGDTLVLRDLEMAMEMPDMTLVIPYPFVRLTPLPNGDIRIDLPAQNRNTVIMNLPDGPVEQTTEITTSGQNILATGAPGNITYLISFAQVDLTQTAAYRVATTERNFTSGGLDGQFSLTAQENGEQALSGAFDIADLTGSWLTTLTADNTGISQGSVETPRLQATVDMALPANFGAEFSAGNSVPRGTGMDIAVSTGPVTLHLDGAENDPDFAFDATSGGTAFGIGLDGAIASYLLDFVDLETTVKNPALPVRESSASLARALLSLSLPLRPTERAEPFSLTLRLHEAILGETLWGIFDPVRVLGRGPAALDLALSGTARMNFDFTKPDRKADLSGPPGTIETFSLDEFSFSYEGMEATGSGKMILDNAAPIPTTGMPDMQGNFDFGIIGAMALLDKIARLPGIDPTIAFGAKGALGMFARPTETPDSFESSVEFSNGGGITVNGMQIR